MTEQQRQMFDTLDVEMQCRLARYAYSLGIDFISNEDYEVLKGELPVTHILHYTMWQDDNIDLIRPFLDSFELYSEGQSIDVSTSDTFKQLSSQFGKNLSIAMADTHDIILEKFIPEIAQNHQKSGIPTIDSGIMSFKLDGWNITNYYDSQGLHLSHTRMKGDGSIPIICTEAMRKLLPDIKWTGGGYLRITTEVAMTYQILPLLRETYGKPFKNTRNSVTSVIHEKIDITRFKDGIFAFAFSVTDTNNTLHFETQEDIFIWLQEHGFDIPNYMVFDATSKDEYLQTFNQMQQHYIDTVQPCIECDGVVFQANYKSVGSEIAPVRAGDFQNGASAIKADYWARKKYKGVVRQIIYTDTKSNNSVIALIDPYDEEGGNTIERVPLNNLGNALAHGIVVGTHIQFSYHSRQIVQFEGVV